MHASNRKSRKQPKPLWPVVFTDAEKEAIRPAARGVRQRILLKYLLDGAPVLLSEFFPGKEYAAAQFRSYERMFKRLENYGVRVIVVRAGPRGGNRHVLTRN